MTGGFRRNHQRCAGLLRHLFAYFGIVTGALVASIGRGARAAFLCDVTCLFPLTGIRKKAGSYRPFSSYIFFDFIIPISMALFMCSLHPAMSFCDIEDFAEVISCIPIILFSPSEIGRAHV